MKLCICHSSFDRVLAGKIGSLCDEMEIEHILDERSDWLMHGLRPRADEVTHLLVIVSPANEKSWWVPFRLGRAREDGIPVLLYPTRPGGGTRRFLGEPQRVHGLETLKNRLRELSPLLPSVQSIPADRFE